MYSNTTAELAARHERQQDRQHFVAEICGFCSALT
jgi:hypothetical protein